ncbi:MAG TPA: TolC family outer membrane protein [Allosphingosinicella sp.]|nr:TolC family outer membrane protein [Allosphingosinicella sp.]
MRQGLLTAAGLAAIALSGGGGALAQTAAPAPRVAPMPPVPPPVDHGREQSLRDALVRTYRTNPTLMAERQSLRQLDETVDIARAAGRPQVSATAGLNQDLLTRNIPGSNGRDFSVGANISMPLYSGGRIRNGIRAADTRVQAGRADLRATEGDIFTEAVAAYMDVIRDRSIVQLNRNQVRVLQTNLQATRDRFEVGDLTRTDVAQSDARLALARSQLALAQGRLETSEENYRRVVGETPEDLQPPPPLPILPGTADQATEVALGNNADLASIAAQTRAAGYDVRSVRGERLPTISAVNSTRYFNSLGRADEAAGVAEGTLPNSTTTSGIGLSLSVPLYQGGAAGARVRRAEALRGQLLEQSVAVERLVISNTRSAFANYRAALEAIESNEIAVAANTLALEGTRAEQTVGTRNVLDVLNAEQELVISQVTLVTARRDAYVAGFQLLNAMGQAEAEDLNLDGGPLYDPVVNYDRYSRSWNDWDDGPRIRPVSTRTAPPNSSSPVTEPPVTQAPQ